MQIILLKEQEGLGKIGDAVKVKDGYARNFLLPKKIAVVATQVNLDRVAKLKKQQEDLDKQRVGEAQALVARVEALSLEIRVKAGEEDKLFGSVTSSDIEDLLKGQGLEIDKRKILLAEPIRKLGQYVVNVKLAADVSANLKIDVQKE